MLKIYRQVTVLTQQGRHLQQADGLTYLGHPYLLWWICIIALNWEGAVEYDKCRKKMRCFVVFLLFMPLERKVTLKWFDIGEISIVIFIFFLKHIVLNRVILVVVFATQKCDWMECFSHGCYAFIFMFNFCLVIKMYVINFGFL